MFCFHKWLPWGKVLETYSGHKQQWRSCSKCNAAQFKTLRWDKQTQVVAVNAALDAVKAAQ